MLRSAHRSGFWRAGGRMSSGRAEARHVFSAKGAAFIISSPRRGFVQRETATAESAIHSGTNLCGTDASLQWNKRLFPSETVAVQIRHSSPGITEC